MTGPVDADRVGDPLDAPAVVGTHEARAMTRAQQHPAGLTAMATTVLVWALPQAGVDMPAEVAASLVGIATIIVSARNPRTPGA